MHVRKEKAKNDKLTCNVRKHTSKQHEREPKPGLYVERWKAKNPNWSMTDKMEEIFKKPRKEANGSTCTISKIKHV